MDRSTSRTACILVVHAGLLALPTAGWAQAPAAGTPNLTLIRPNATVSQIDTQNIQTWVDQQTDTLFASSDLDTDAPKFRAALVEHFQAGDASPAFKQILASNLATSLGRLYKGTTSLRDANVPRPLPVTYALVLLVLFDDPSALPVLRQGLLDNSNPPAPGVRATALDGLIHLRERMNPQVWTGVAADAQKAATDENNPVVLQRIYRLLSADAPAERTQQGIAAILKILTDRLNRVEQKGLSPSLADREAAMWLGARAATSQNAQRVNDIALQLGRLLADAVYSHSLPDSPPFRKEQMERLILATEQALLAVANAKAAGRPHGEVVKAMQAGGADQAKHMSDEVDKWIGSRAAPGLLSGPPFNLPAGLNIQHVAPTTATATATASE